MTEKFQMTGTDGVETSPEMASKLIAWDKEVVEASLGDEQRLIIDAVYVINTGAIELEVAEGKKEEVTSILFFWGLIPLIGQR